MRCSSNAAAVEHPLPGHRRDDNALRADMAFAELQTRFWNATAGRYDASIWWQQANALEAVCNLAIKQPKHRPEAGRILAAAFAATANQTKGRCNQGVDLTFSGYFDDEEWWPARVRSQPQS